MLRALHTAATGMEAMQTNLDSVSNNLANVNTTAFKKDEAQFKDLYYQQVREPGVSANANTSSPTGVQVGTGVVTASVHKVFEQGSAKMTGNSLDLMVSGDGFFAIQKETGELAFTRDGAFKLDAQGRIVNNNGLPLVPAITIPPGTARININTLGAVEVIDSAGKAQQVGQLEIANFINPQGLKSLGGNLYQVTEASGAPNQGTPGANGLGTIDQGRLESSNVNIVNEMVNMIHAQRAYEMNSKTMQAADRMLEITSNVVK